MTFDELVAAARQRAEQLLRSQLEHLPAVRSTEEALNLLHDIEQDVFAIGGELTELREGGLLKQEDITAFDRIRVNLRAAQQRLLTFVRGVFAGHPEVLRQLPTTAPLAPALAQNTYTQPHGTQLPVNMAPWAIAGIIIAALIALGLLVYLGSRIYNTFDGLVDLYVLREQSQQMRDLYEARRAALAQCMAEQRRLNQPTSMCYGAAAQMAPTPQQALVPLPPVKDNTIYWFIGGGLAVAALVGLGAWLVYRGRGSNESERPRRRRAVDGYRQLSADTFDDAHDSDYNLEVHR